MGRSVNHRKAQAAWDRIEALGGHGVWEPDVVVVSLAKTRVTDEDLSLFRDLPMVQILDLSHTSVGDSGLTHLSELRGLESLCIVGTKISESAVVAFRRDHPTVSISTVPPSKDALNPFTGRPFD